MMAAKKTVSCVEIVDKHWGECAPHWVIQLAEECDKSTQAAVARKIDRSAALVNQVLKKSYNADLSSIQSRVETVFGCPLSCPILGLIDGARCLEEQGKPYSPHNHIRVSLYRACRKCPHRIKKGDEQNDQE